MKRNRQFAGTLGALIDLYQASPDFARLKPTTQTSYEYGLRLAKAVLGDCPLSHFSKHVFREFLDQFGDRPATQKMIRSTLTTLETWALQRDYLAHPMMYLVKVRGGDGAREPWTDDEVRLFETHGKPDLARVVTVARWSGQRAGDLCILQWQQFKLGPDGYPIIELKQKKTGLPLWVPVVPELQAVIDTWDRSAGYVLTKADGSPWTRSQLSSAFGHERNKNPALAPLMARKLSLHGLRASAVIGLRLKGWSDSDVAAFVGMSEKMVARYARRGVRYLQVREAMRRTGMEQSNVVALRSLPPTMAIMPAQLGLQDR